MGAVALASMVGPIMLLVLSPYGVHATNDSFTYLGAADNLARGAGWTYPFGDVGAPVTLFPPLYSLLLTVPVLLHVSWFDWVMAQNAILLAGFSLAVGLSVLWGTDGRAIPAAIVSLLVPLGTPTLIAYAHIWSETLFFPLVVVTLASTARHLATRRMWPLVAAAVLSSIALLTRYAGLSLFVTVCLLLLLWPRRRLRDRAIGTGLYAGIASPLSALWLLRNLVVSGTLTGDNELIHELTADAVLEGSERIARWFSPNPAAGAVADVLTVLAAVSLLAVVVALTVSATRAGTGRVIALPPIAAVCLSYAVLHFSFIAIANAFSTRAPPFNDRILGPVFAPLLIAVVVVGHAIWRAAPRPSLRAALATAGVALLVLWALAAIDSIPRTYGSRLGTSAEYRGFVRVLDGLVPSRAAVFSTRPNVAWFLLRRPVSSLPRSCRGGRVLPDPWFGRELQELGVRLADRDRAVILFKRSKECAPFTISRLKATLRLAKASPRGLVWVLTGPAEPS